MNFRKNIKGTNLLLRDIFDFVTYNNAHFFS